MSGAQATEVQHHASLKPYNTLGFDVSAEHLAIIDDWRQLPGLIARYGPPKLVLGGGSNVVITQDLIGLVILNRIKGKALQASGETNFMLTLGAGEEWDEAVRFACGKQLWGIENLALIPGTVGAAPIQNIGAYGVELCSVLNWVDTYELATGKARRFTNAECQFGYRHSVFKAELKNRYLITQIGLELSSLASPQLDYEPIKQRLQSLAEPIHAPAQIYDIVCDIRTSKLPDPKILPNVGSFFKNPVVSQKQFNALRREQTNIPNYPAGGGLIKLAAGWLIDRAGWKGKQSQFVGVHKNQALVLVNHNNGKPQDILELAEQIRLDVRQKFDVDLELEPLVISN